MIIVDRVCPTWTLNSAGRRHAPSRRGGFMSLASDECRSTLPNRLRSTRVTIKHLMAEHDRLAAEHEALQREHAELHERPDDLPGHQAHRAKLRTHMNALHAHVQDWQEYARKL
jgi:hypothetical protein